MILDAIRGELEKNLGKFLFSGMNIYRSIKKESQIFKQIKKETIKSKNGQLEQEDIIMKILLNEERDVVEYPFS